MKPAGHSRRGRFSAFLSALALPLLALGIWKCEFLQPKEGTTLLDVTMVDSLTAANGYDRVTVEVRDSGGGMLANPFDGAYDPAADGPVLRDIDLGPNPPAVMEIRITGYKRDGSIVVFTKKISGLTAEKAWSKVPPSVPDPDEPVLTLEPRDLYLGVDSLGTLTATLDPAGDDSLVWTADNVDIAILTAAGQVKGVSPGETYVKVVSYRDGSLRDSALVHVSRVVDSVDSIRLVPDAMILYTGGEPDTLKAQIHPANPDNQARFSSLSEDLATVDARGRVVAVAPGTALIVAYPVGHPDILDTCVVTVKRDKPVIDAGPARRADLGIAVDFPVKVTQEYGTVAVLKWDLDGDGIWEDSVVNADTANPSFAYASAKTYKARFQAWDGEGNVDSASVIVAAGGNAPLVDITRPGRDTVVNTPVFRLEYTVNSEPRSRDIVLEYGPHKVGVAETIAGETGTDSVVIAWDTIPPKVVITSPAKGATTRAGSIAVAWMVDSVAQFTGLSENLADRQGPVIIRREAFDEAGNRGADSVIIVRDTVKPKVLIESPFDGAVVKSRTVPVKWMIDGQTQTADTIEILAAGDGPKRIARNAVDAAGNRDSAAVNVILDEFAPGTPLRVASTTTPSPTRKDTLYWGWSSGGNGNGIYRYVRDADAARTTGTTAGNYLLAVPGLPEGVHVLKVQESDDQGNWSGFLVDSIVVDRTPPRIAITGGDRTVAADTFTIVATVSDTGAGSGLSGPVSLTGSLTGTLARQGADYRLTVTLNPGVNTLTVTAKDLAGNTGTASISVTYNPVLPPFRVLVFNRALGFVHVDGVRAASDMISRDLPTLVDSSARFLVDTTSDSTVLSSANLAPYSVLVLNNNSGWGYFGAAKRTAILDFAATKGVVVIHGVYDASWPEFTSLSGITALAHSLIQSATLQNSAAAHAINTGLSASFTSTEEWWAYDPNPADNPDLTTLWTLDESSGYTGPAMPGGHPMVWCRTLPGGGRFFYTGQGHNATNFVKTGMLGRLLYNAILWTAKRDP